MKQDIALGKQCQTQFLHYMQSEEPLKRELHT